MEPHEYVELGIPDLFTVAHACHIRTRHLPIVDTRTPDPAQAAAVDELVEAIHDDLVAGKHVVIHCRGGQLDTPPDHARRRPTQSPLDEHLPFLQRRWREGCRNAAQLTRELREHGYQGTRRTVARYVRHWRTDDEDQPFDITAIRPPIAVLDQPNKLAWNLLKDEPGPTTQQLLDHVSDAEHHANLARAGINAIRHHDIDAWNAWCRVILKQPNNPLKRFVTGLKTDYHAVINALTHPYSNGPTEGNVNRLKLIKRTMYGRASFQLLRNKVLYQPTQA